MWQLKQIKEEFKGILIHGSLPPHATCTCSNVTAATRAGSQKSSLCSTVDQSRGVSGQTRAPRGPGASLSDFGTGTCHPSEKVGCLLQMHVLGGHGSPNPPRVTHMALSLMRQRNSPWRKGPVQVSYSTWLPPMVRKSLYLGSP